MRTLMRISITVAALLTSQFTIAQQLTQRITNQDVIEMVAMGLPDDVIIQKIRTLESPQFDTSVQALRILKSKKVSDAVIRVMINPHPEITPPAMTAPTLSSVQSALPQEIGVYYKRTGEFVQLDPEIVGWQTGGVLKHYASLGVQRGHINGKVMTPHSQVQLSCPVEFLIKTTDGTSVTEYQLLKLYEKGNRREFRAWTGGIIHAKAGAERTAISFHQEKMGVRVWRVRLNGLQRGEYGFLPPGVAASSIAASGKIYAFGITGEDSAQMLSDAHSPEQNGSVQDSNFVSTEPSSGVLGVSGANWAEDGLNGVEILKIAPESAAELAGLHVHQVIVQVNGIHIRSTGDLKTVLARSQPGGVVTLDYLFKSNLGWMSGETQIALTK